MANKDAILAIGYPVALLAKADERETRGLISMAMISSESSGLTANWTLHPPAKLPIERIILMAMVRMRWKVESESVIAGATVMESPVCTPIGSKFSIEQMMATLSFASRNNSNSNSFQPRTALSINTSWMGEVCKPRLSAASKSSFW